jgi:lysophospholipase L1-like esterase
MKRSIFILAIGLIAINLSAQICTKPFHIVILGSSTALGYGATPKKSWARLFEDSLKNINPNYIVDNLAVAGTTTYAAQPDDYVPPAGRPLPSKGHNITKAIKLGADAVIVNYPSNDAVLNYTPDEQKDNYRRISDEAAKHNILVWVATPQPRNTLTRRQVNYQQKMFDWINKYYGGKAINFHDGIASEKDSILFKYNAGDGIHVNNKGHKILYERVIGRSIPDTLCKTSVPVAQKKSPTARESYPTAVQ